MTLGLALGVGALGAFGSGWGLARGGTAARLGAAGGLLAILLVAVLTAASPTPATLAPDASGGIVGTLWNGALVPNGYLRLVVALWAVCTLALAPIVWLLRGMAGLHSLLPATLGALVGSTVALAASSASLGLLAAAAAGLAAVPALLATPRAAAPGIAAREVRVTVGTGLVLLAVASIVPVLARLVLADPGGPAASPGSGVMGAVAIAILAMTLAVAGRVGAIPWHRRLSTLTDALPAGTLPLVAVWLPLPLVSFAVGVASAQIAPLAPQVGTAQAVVVALALIATLAAVLVALLQDNLRHAVGYITIADLSIVVLAIVALDPAAWGAARVWLLTIAVSKTALAAWAVVAEDRFGTRSVPELRGWIRAAPVLGGALVLVVIASIGLPGWAVASARQHLAGLAADGPWDAFLMAASLLTIPAYARWLWLGVGSPTSHVDRALPEFAALGRLPVRRLGLTPPGRPGMSLPVEQEDSAARGTADTAAPGMTPPRPAAQADLPVDTEAAGARTKEGPRAGGAASLAVDAVRRRRAGVLSGAVLVLAVVASLVAAGAFDLETAASAPVPAAPGITAFGG